MSPAPHLQNWKSKLVQSFCLVSPFPPYLPSTLSTMCLSLAKTSPASWCVGACFMRSKLTFSCQCCVLYRFPILRGLGVTLPAPANLSCMCHNVLIDSQRSRLAESVLAYINFRFRLRVHVATATQRLQLQIAAEAVWLGAHLAQDQTPPPPCAMRYLVRGWHIFGEMWQ